MQEYIEKLYNACSRGTCYPKVREHWSADNRFWGHCAVVSVLMFEKFGGKLFKCVIKEENIEHYFNEIGGKKCDVTISQYKYQPTYENIKEVTKEEILKNPDTQNRYNKLKTRF
ncbi:MAG: hypothetical protein FWD89_03960 [Firmicutes bacterium]|nr:hypothetical protein [Bacillota bacterium]MCL2771438.1 hypothetical protein [Bacillota bacterium]